MEEDFGRVGCAETGSTRFAPEAPAGLRPSGDDPARRAPIYGYARALGKALIQVAPEDLRMQWTTQGRSSPFSISCTIADDYEAEAVIEIIRTMAHLGLSSHREAVHGDIYPEAPPTPSFREEMERMFGPVVTFTCDRDAAEGRDANAARVQQDRQARAEGIAHKEAP